LLTGGAAFGAEGLAARVVVLANRDDPDSLRIARHYAEVRGVPAANVIALPMPQTETVSWPEFVRSVWQPLQDELVQRSWLDAIRMKLVDEVGRTKMAFSGHRISYLVVCRGVPLRIAHDPALYRATPLSTRHVQLRTNAGAVDSELSLLAQTDYEINGFVENPLFGDDRPLEGDLSRVIKVSRLDGPGAEDALRLVDRAVEAERRGLIGRAYVDIGGNHPDGDVWFESAARQLSELGFDLDVDRAPTTFPATARFDAPVLYFGWYAGNVDGPFTLPGFRFPPGAIAVHIHSYSATTLREADARWTGPLIARGVTATVGNVYEPYLAFLHRPDLLLRALARGDTWGDAAAYALPVLSWQSVAIGDPLYRPFSVSLDSEWANRARLDNGALGYVVVRRMLDLEQHHRGAEAMALGRQVQNDRPSIELGAALAERMAAASDWAGVQRVLTAVPGNAALRPDQWALRRRTAELLFRAGRADEAEAATKALLAMPALTPDFRQLCLADALKFAEAAGRGAAAELWRQQLSEGARLPAGGAR
jgi:uncharacterized protein (TIGR03790 family)